MIIDLWDVSQYNWLNFVAIGMIAIVFVGTAIFKLRKNTIKHFAIAFVVAIVLSLVGVKIINTVTPYDTYMYYKYDDNMQVIMLSENGWDFIEHYGNKKIIYAVKKGGL